MIGVRPNAVDSLGRRCLKKRLPRGLLCDRRTGLRNPNPFQGLCDQLDADQLRAAQASLPDRNVSSNDCECCSLSMGVGLQPERAAAVRTSALRAAATAPSARQQAPSWDKPGSSPKRVGTQPTLCAGFALALTGRLRRANLVSSWANRLASGCHWLKPGAPASADPHRVPGYSVWLLDKPSVQHAVDPGATETAHVAAARDWFRSQSRSPPAAPSAWMPRREWLQQRGRLTGRSETS